MSVGKKMVCAYVYFICSHMYASTPTQFNAPHINVIIFLPNLKLIDKASLEN